MKKQSKELERKLDGNLVICSDVYSVLDCLLYSKYCIYIDSPYEDYQEMEACDKIEEILSWASFLKEERLTKNNIKQWLVTALSLQGFCLYYDRIEKYKVEEDHVFLSLLGGYKVKLYSDNIQDNSQVNKKVTRVFDHYKTRDLYLRGTHYLDSAVDKVYIHKRNLIATTDIPTNKKDDFDYSSVAFRYDIKENLPTDDRFYLKLIKRESCYKIKDYERYKEKWATETSIVVPRAYISLSAAYHYKTTNFLLSSPLKFT